MNRHPTGVSSFVFLVTSIFQSASFADTRTFDDFPATAFGCDFEAKDLGDRIAAYGIKVRSTKCISESKSAGTYSLQVTFDRPTGFTEESTYRNGSNFYGSGWYANLADCEADLPDQVQAFQLATGIDPYISYCSKKGSSYDDLPYWPRIEAVGKADMHLVSSDLDFSYVGEVDVATMKQLLTLQLDTGFRRLVHIANKNGVFTVAFYTTGTSTDLDASALMKFNTKAECDDALPTAIDVYSNRSNTPLALVCGKAPYGSKQYVLISVTSGYPGVNLYGQYDYHTTYAQCVAELPTTIAALQSSGEDVLGAVCAYYYSYYMTYTFHPR